MIHDIARGYPFVESETFHLGIKYAACELQCLLLRQFTILFTLISVVDEDAMPCQLSLSQAITGLLALGVVYDSLDSQLERGDANVHGDAER